MAELSLFATRGNKTSLNSFTFLYTRERHRRHRRVFFHVRVRKIRMAHFRIWLKGFFQPFQPRHKSPDRSVSNKGEFFGGSSFFSFVRRLLLFFPRLILHSRTENSLDRYASFAYSVLQSRKSFVRAKRGLPFAIAILLLSNHKRYEIRGYGIRSYTMSRWIRIYMRFFFIPCSEHRSKVIRFLLAANQISFTFVSFCILVDLCEVRAVQTSALVT